MAQGGYDSKMMDEDDKDIKKEMTVVRKFREWDCPGCNANNPHEGFEDGAEVLCNYCGNEYKVKVSDGGKARFREI